MCDLGAIDLAALGEELVTPEFLAELHLGRAAARARLAGAPTDAEALFYLGKLNLNYVWLQLGTRGTRTHDLHSSR